MRRTITLTSDFGSRDPYVAAMKGVIVSICPDAEVMDLTHEVAPGSILEGALFLAGAVPYFPKGTLHVAVVDPGVGTRRLPILAQLGGQTVVCPDNGLLTLLSRSHPLESARAITNPKFQRKEISATFHGRDVFAPTAAHLAAGADPSEVGAPLESIQMLQMPQAKEEDGDRVVGEVIHIDRFGNLVTNIHRSMLGQSKPVAIEAGSLHLSELSRTYGDVGAEDPLALIGSSNYLEIAVNQGNAHEMLGLGRGDRVQLQR